jgi:hypothetical protein
MTALKKRAKKKAKKAASPKIITLTIADDKTFRSVSLESGELLRIVGPKDKDVDITVKIDLDGGSGGGGPVTIHS